jgi:hypothetical protein
MELEVGGAGQEDAVVGKQLFRRQTSRRHLLGEDIALYVRERRQQLVVASDVCLRRARAQVQELHGCQLDEVV